jgi:hypothetical protein
MLTLLINAFLLHEIRFRNLPARVEQMQMIRPLFFNPFILREAEIKYVKHFESD